MDSSKRVIGFAAAFIMFATVSVAALKPIGGEVRILQPQEAAMIRGGSGGGGKASAKEDITLKNVPYITQHLNSANYGSIDIARSKRYCGIAAALMVRAKNEKDTANAPSSLWNGWDSVNYQTVDTAMKRIDDNLKLGYYGFNAPKVDVLTNKGLLYINPNLSSINPYDATAQFDVTAAILRGVYTGTSGDPLNARKNSDAISFDKGHVTGVMMWATGAQNATSSIWNHIKNNHQPAVVVVDSNKQVANKVISSPNEPTLHYIVIMGISEESPGGTRYFSVYNPGIYIGGLKYSEQDLQKLIALPRNTPAWVYYYGNPIVGSDPAYVLTVQGD